MVGLVLAGPMALTLPAVTVPALAAPSPAHITAAATWTLDAQPTSRPTSVPAGPADPSVRLPGRGCRVGARPGPEGEGILSLTMAGPGTSWASETDTAVTVDLRVDSMPTQQVVLFDGAEPFRYQAFTGPMSSGRHCVTVTVDAAASHVSSVPPSIDMYAVSLALVRPSSPQYALETHDPVLYGRSTSALGDTPLITYGEQSADPDGVDNDLSYTVIWTHEDVGDGVVAAYEWGLWGRMTDIETVLDEKVSPSGRVLSARYLSCGCEGSAVYPDLVPEDPADGGETYKSYPASGTTPGLGHHLGLRDATGNNDIAPSGTTAYRFQQALVAGPGPGASRELAMDDNPWTYRISGEEVSREAAQSSDPRNFLAGSYPQYLVVDINSEPVGTGSVAVEVQLNGSAWYSNDYEQLAEPLGSVPSTFPFYNGGHDRTVIKLPTDWHTSKITGLRLRLNAAQPGVAPRMTGRPAIQLIEVTDAYGIVVRPDPPLQVADGTQVIPSSLGH